MKIRINETMVDYLTVTTEYAEIASQWLEKLELEYGTDGDRIKRYEGYRGLDNGTQCFIGQSVGKAKKHYIMQISGEMANRCIGWVDPETVENEQVRVTRIDVQRTIEQPERWSQIAYADDCETMGHKPSVSRSRDPINRGENELITVYTGTKKSGRLNRLYQKVMLSGELFLRYETEYSRGYSIAVYKAIVQGISLDAILTGEIDRRKMGSLLIFSGTDESHEPKQEKREIVDKKEAWLMRDILPVFWEYINSHDANPAIERAFMEAIISRQKNDGEIIDTLHGDR